MTLALTPTPRLRRSPYYEATLRSGASQFTVYNHMLLPTAYAGPVAEYEALTERVAVWDVAAERQVEVAGPDARRLVSRVVCRDISRLRPGRGRYVLACNPAGGVLNDPVLLCLAEDRFWLSLADRDLLLWVQAIGHEGGFDARVIEPEVAPLQVQGPRSPDVMAALFGDWVRELRYYRFREVELDGVPMLVARTGWSGEYGYEIFLQSDSHGGWLWDRVLAAGEPRGIAPGAPNQIRRIEGGILSYGTDMDDSVNPYELGLGRLVDLDAEAEFVGKAALRSISAAGAARRLAGVVIPGEPISTGGHLPVTAAGRPVGRVSSVAWSPRFDANVALALLETGTAEPGIDVEVAGRPGVTHALPFVAPVR